MLTTTPFGLDKFAAADSASLAAYLGLEFKSPSGGTATPPPDPESDDDIDGCEVAVEKATPDEDLPASEGGVA